MRRSLILLISLILCASTLAPGCANADRSVPKSSDRYSFPFSALTDTLNAEQENAVAVARQQFPELNDIGEHAPFEIGYSGDIFIQDEPDGWKVIFYSGWGDCPAGCINGRWHYVSVDTSGLATMIGRFKREYDPSTNTYLDSGVAIWGMPK